MSTQPVADRGLTRQLGPTQVVPGLRAIMLVGGSLTIGVWLFTGLFFGHRISEIQEQADVVSQRFLRAQQLLLEARTQVLLSAIALREALLDPAEPFATTSRHRMMEALDIAEDNLERYVPILDEVDEAKRVARLVDEIATLRREMTAVLASDRQRTAAEVGALLRGSVMERREAVVGVATEFGTLNRLAFVAYQSNIRAIYRRTQLQVWQALGLAVVASMAIALVAVGYIKRLERQVAAQQARDLTMQADLQRLSSALIKAREDERRSIARELHDEIGQLLTAVKVKLASVRRSAGGALPWRQSLDEGVEIIDRALHGVRDLTRLLHPTVLEDLGLVAGIDWLTREFHRQHALTVAFQRRDCDDRYPPDVENTAYRIVQEALTNVVKHAHASSCTLRLVGGTDHLTVEIEDDGVGFDAAENAHHGLGLVSMRERAHHLGGTVEFGSAGERGTRVRVTLPLPPATGATA